MKLATFGFWTLFGKITLACSCAGIQPFCNALPARDAKGSAVFVGRVESVYPSTSVFEFFKQFEGVEPENRKWERIAEGLIATFGKGLTPQQVATIRSATNDTLPQIFDKILPKSRTARLLVTERFSGIETEYIDIQTGWGNGDCGVGFTAGDEWLVDAYQDKDGAWHANICSRTRMAKYAAGDLTALRAWKDGKPVPREIRGTIEDWTKRTDAPLNSKPLDNVTLSVRAGNEVRKTRTDSNGAFRFEGLEAKQYLLEHSLPGYRFGRASDRTSINLIQNKCSELFLYVQQAQGILEGKVVPSTGTLPRSLWMEAIPTNGDPKLVRTESAKENGSFAIDEIEPGDYWIGLNVAHAPLTENGRGSAYDRLSPYPPMYHPGVTDPARATIFHVERGQTVASANWVLPEQSRERSIDVRVVWADGRPAHGASLTLLMPQKGLVTYYSKQNTDGEGRAPLYGVAGVHYRVYASVRNEADQLFYKAVANIDGSAGAVTLVLEPDGPTRSKPE